MPKITTADRSEMMRRVSALMRLSFSASVAPSTPKVVAESYERKQVTSHRSLSALAATAHGGQ